MTYFTGSLSDCAFFSDTGRVSCALGYVMRCEDYFHLGCRSVLPITRLTGSTVQIGQKYRRVESSCCTTAVKVASWFLTLGLMPLVAGISVGVGRCYYRIKVDRNEFIKDTARLIRKTAARSPRTNRDLQSVDRILGELYLGGGLEFLDCTGMAIFARDKTGNVVGMRNTSNPRQYKQIVTLCPLEVFEKETDLFSESHVYDQTCILENYFQAIKVDWYYFGRTILDVQNQDAPDLVALKWATLVHDCSVESPLAEFSMEEESEQHIYAIRATKAAIVDRMQPQSLFQRAFNVFDKAVFENQKTLVHCARGMSRSVTAVIAYIIKTFGVTAEEATRFVQCQHAIASPRFPEQLRNYQQLLNPAPPLSEQKWALTKEERLELV